MDIFVKSLKSLFVAASLMTATYATAESAFILDPAPGEVTELSMIKISFDGDWGLGSSRSARFVITGPEGVEIPRILSQSFENYYGVFFDNDAELTTPGTYTFTIPDNKFMVNGSDLPGETFEYTIVKGADPEPLPAYTMDPESGVYKTIDYFTMTFDTTEPISIDRSKVSIAGPKDYYTLNCTIDDATSTVKMIAVNEDNSEIQLRDPGDYTLAFERGAITIGNATNRQRIAYTYTITGNNVGHWTGEVDVTPANGSVVDELHKFSVVYTGAGVVKSSDSAGPNDFPALYDVKTGQLVCTTIVFSVANRLDLTLTKIVNEPGQYQLVIPTHMVKVDGYYPEEPIILDYTVKGDIAEIKYSYTFTPEPGTPLGAMEPVMITFTGDDIASMSYDVFAWGKNIPHFVNDFGGYNPNLQTSQNGLTFAMTHEWPFEASGTYTLVIPAGYFIFIDNEGKEMKSDLISVDYLIGTTSITSITDEQKATDIYHVTGVKVNSDPASLAPGMYIIGGKKTFIK